MLTITVLFLSSNFSIAYQFLLSNALNAIHLTLDIWHLDISVINGTKYSRMDQVKFEENSL